MTKRRIKLSERQLKNLVELNMDDLIGTEAIDKPIYGTNSLNTEQESIDDEPDVEGYISLEEGPNPACPPVSCQNAPYMVQAPATHPTQPCECVRASSLQKKKPTISRPEDAPKGRMRRKPSRTSSVASIIPKCFKIDAGGCLECPPSACNNQTNPCPYPTLQACEDDNGFVGPVYTEGADLEGPSKYGWGNDAPFEDSPNFNVAENSHHYVHSDQRIGEQQVTSWDCVDNKCVEVVGKGGVGAYATEQECEDDYCGEGPRPTGTGKGKDDMYMWNGQAQNITSHRTDKKGITESIGKKLRKELMTEKSVKCCCKMKLNETTGRWDCTKWRKSCCEAESTIEIRPVPVDEAINRSLNEGMINEKKEKMCCVCLKLIEAIGGERKWKCCGWKKCSDISVPMPQISQGN
jgi:hypothetical protein